MSDTDYLPPVEIGRRTFLTEFDSLLDQHPQAEWRMSGAKTKSPENENFWRTNGPKWVEGYYKWRMANPYYRVATLPNGSPAIEVAFNVKVPNSDVVVKGYADRVFIDTRDDSKLIVDLKSGKTGQASPMQLGFYRLGWSLLFGEDIRWGAYYDARKASLDAIYDLDQFPVDMIARWLRNADKQIRQNIFLPDVSRDCGWCSVREHCYIWNPEVPRPDFNSDIEEQ